MNIHSPKGLQKPAVSLYIVIFTLLWYLLLKEIVSLINCEQKLLQPAAEKTHSVESIVYLIIFKTGESCITNTKKVRKFNFDSPAADAH